jgi:hypothetical protein
MSTNKESRELQSDLNAELMEEEEDDQSISDSFSIRPVATSDNAPQQEQSSSSNNERQGKKLRTRPQPTKYKALAKRRRTSDDDDVDNKSSSVSGNQSDLGGGGGKGDDSGDEEEPVVVAGPSSKSLVEPKVPKGDKKALVGGRKYLERMEADTSEEDDEDDLTGMVTPGIASVSSRRPSGGQALTATRGRVTFGGDGGREDVNDDDDGIFEEAIQKLAEATKKYQRGMKEDISSSRRIASERSAATATVAAAAAIAGPSGSSAVFEDWFRNPVFEMNPLEQGGGVAEQDGGLSAVTVDQEARSEQDGLTNESNDTNSVAAQEKQNIMWARKLFFKSSELVFPGITRGMDWSSKRNGFCKFFLK